MNILLNILKNQIKRYINQEFNVQNVQAMFESIGAILKSKVENTETGIDDWVISVLCKLVADSDLASMLVEIVQAAIVQTDGDGNVILHDAASCRELSERLAAGLESAEVGADGELVCAAVPWTAILKLVKVVSTVLTAWAQLSDAE